jgi:serine/threonine protein phosphatase PrpC
MGISQPPSALDDSATTAPPEVLRPTAPSTVIMPKSISFDWPEEPTGESLVELLQDGQTQLPPGTLLDALPRLLPAWEEWHVQGAAVLAPWSLRLTGDTVTAWCAPGLGATVAWPEHLRRITSHGPSADLHALGLLLHRLASGRWARDAQTALVDAGILGGDWPAGTDLAILACLHPDPGRRAQTAGDLLDRITPFLAQGGRPMLDRGTRVQVADESVTGWTKSRGRPDGDNEDAAAWDWTGDGLVAAVLDGVAGPGDGGGRWASHELRRKLRAQWRHRVWDPREALEAAAAAMGSAPKSVSPDSCTVGVVVRIDSTHLDWACIGDCRLYLARPRSQGMSVSRLSAEHTVSAAALRAGREVTLADTELVTSALPRPQRALAIGRANIFLGDVVLLVSDGACRMPADTDDLADWRFPDVLHDLLIEADQAHAPLLVSQLCRRAEELGGEDNATALAVVCGPVPPAILNRPVRRRSILAEEMAPLMRAD